MCFILYDTQYYSLREFNHQLYFNFIRVKFSIYVTLLYYKIQLKFIFG